MPVFAGLSGEFNMDVEVLIDSKAVAQRAAAVVTADARKAIAQRGKFVMAVSGGKTPWMMLREFAREQLPWNNVHVFQIDERIAPAGDPDRNLTHLGETLLSNAPIRPDQIHPMLVELADPDEAARQYEKTLQDVAGNPPVLDLVHLGMGPDGHTASLIPGDSVLRVEDRDVAVTGVYQGRKRLTLTYPILNRARNILWLVTGTEKQAMLRRLRKADPSIPAGRVRQDNAVLLVDREAAGDSAENQ
jgi:6-phosphogluconolactonase